MENSIPMQVPYGAVYFRKSNPPKQDWERDYAKAAADGMNIFRHWFMWGAIEVAPGVFDWEDYDRQLELAAKYGIKTIIAEMDGSIPEWLAHRYPELLCEYSDGRKSWPEMGGSSSTGGFCGGLCLDKPKAKKFVGNFLRRLAERYKDHPGMLGYDVWNECNYSHSLCYCADTYAAFQKWLKNKYGSLKALMSVWHKYSYTSFDEIRAPFSLSSNPDSMDWLEFRRQNAYDAMKWRIDTIQETDKTSLITAHGVGSSVSNLPMGGSDEWMAADRVEVYGLTWIPARKGSEPWKQWHAVDLVRSGSRGKPFWHAEMQGNALWLQPQTTGRPRLDGRIAREQDIRIWNLTSLACGARGILYLRWRSLLNGPLFGAFGPYDMDGSETERSRMASKIAKWANAPEQKPLFEASPVKGDVGILFVPECAQASYLLAKGGEEDIYPSMMWGAYRAYFDSNIQADFVHVDDIGNYDLIYFPYPVALTAEHREKIKAWVAEGGTLICEACPAFWNDELAVSPVQPGYGYDELFGVKQKRVEIMPDIFTDIEFELDGSPMRGAGYLQTYTTVSAEARGSFEGEVIAAENRFGKGKTLLIGTCPSRRYYLAAPKSRLGEVVVPRGMGEVDEKGSAAVLSFFAETLRFADKKPALGVTVSGGDIHVRIHKNGGNTYLWALNCGDEPGEAVLRAQGRHSVGTVFWGEAPKTENDGTRIEIPPRDAAVFEII